MKNQLLSLCFVLIITFSNAQTLTTSNAVLNFGVVYENAPDSIPLTIYNNLGKIVNVTGFRFYNIYGQKAFSCSNSTFTIYDGSSQTVWIKFSPQQNIFHNTELVIENDAHRGYVSVDLTGQGRYSKSYYSTSENLDEENLKTELKNITGNGYTSLGYNAARDSMFMWLDNQKVNGQGAAQNTLECIYTGRLAVGYIDRADCQTNDQFNTEHTFPQSFFNSLEPMRSDLNHLFPTDDAANTVRSNYPFGTVTNATWTNGGSEFDNNTNIFEPRDKQKGPTARAMLYFVIRYQNYNSFLDTQEGILKTWNNNFLPTTIEQTRNDNIYLVQNNRNPFVDYPQLARRITSFSNTSVAVPDYSVDMTQNQMDYGLILYGTSNVYHYVIVNYGNQVIQLSNFNLSNPSILSFTGSSGSNATLNPGEALGIDIDLHPVAAGPVNETLTFQTSVSSLPNVSIPITAQASAVGLQNICNTNETDVYPNPAVDKVFIKWNSSAMSCNVKIYDAMGNVIIQNQKVTKDNFEMDLSHLNQGIYFIHIEMPGNIEVRRLTIIR